MPINKIVRVQTTGRRRDPRLRGPGLRHQDRRHSGPPQRDLVQGDEGRRLLRPVLGAVRQGSRLHADRRCASSASRPLRPGSSDAKKKFASRAGQQQVRGRERGQPLRRRRGRSTGDRTRQGSRDEDYGNCNGTPRRSRPSRRPRASDRMAPVRLFDEPQGHRHDVPGLRDHRRCDRRRALGRHAHGAAGAGPAVLRRTATPSTCSSPATASSWSSSW